MVTFVLVIWICTSIMWFSLFFVLGEKDEKFERIFVSSIFAWPLLLIILISPSFRNKLMLWIKNGEKFSWKSFWWGALGAFLSAIMTSLFTMDINLGFLNVPFLSGLWGLILLIGLFVGYVVDTSSKIAGKSLILMPFVLGAVLITLIQAAIGIWRYMNPALYLIVMAEIGVGITLSMAINRIKIRKSKNKGIKNENRWKEEAELARSNLWVYFSAIH